MKKSLLFLPLLTLGLVACKPTTSSASSSSPAAPSVKESDKAPSETPAPSEEVEAGATDTGEGGLNYGDIDWTEEMKKTAVKTYLSGINGNHREMMQIATVKNGKPAIASVEYYMDTESLSFFGSSESDTGKIKDLKNDPNCSLYWTRQLRASDMAYAPNYFTSYGVEVEGKAYFYTANQVNQMSDSEKASLIKIARGYYQSMGAQYKKFYDSTADGYLDDAAFVSYVFNPNAATSAYIIKPTKIVLTSPYLLFVSYVADATKEDGYYFAVKQGAYTMGEYSFLPKTFLKSMLDYVRTQSRDETLTKFTKMKEDFSGATGLKTQVTLRF